MRVVQGFYEQCIVKSLKTPAILYMKLNAFVRFGWQTSEALQLHFHQHG